MPLPKPIDMEMFLLEAGIRRVARKDGVPKEKADKLARRFAKKGLHAFVIPKEYDVDPQTGRYDYMSGGRCVTVVAAREKHDLFEAVACIFMEIYPGANATALGGLLGYPECCVRAYLENPLKNSRVALAVSALNRTKGALSPYLNDISAGMRFAVHHPCRYDCPESLRIVTEALKAAGRDNEPVPKYVTLLLGNRGLSVDFDGAATASEISYRPGSPSGTATELIRLLINGNRCLISRPEIVIFMGETRIGSYRESDPFIFNWGGAAVYAPGHFDEYLKKLNFSTG